MQKIKEGVKFVIGFTLFVAACFFFLPSVTTDELRFERSQDTIEDIWRVMLHAENSEIYDSEFIEIHSSQIQECMEGKAMSDWVPLSVLPGTIPVNAEKCNLDQEWYVPEKYRHANKKQSFNRCYIALEEFENLSDAGLLLNKEPAPFDRFGCSIALQ